MARMRQYSASALGDEEGAATLTWQPSPLKLSVPLWKQPSRSWGETQQRFPGCPSVWDKSTALTASFSASVGVQERLPSRRRRAASGHPHPHLTGMRGQREMGTRSGSLCQQFTFTGLSVAEKASCRAQQASLHISSVNTGPAVTRTYLFEETRKGVLNLYVLLPLQKHTQIHPTASVHALLPLVFNPAGVPLSQHDFLRHFTIKYHGGPTTNRAMFQFRLACKTVYILFYFFHSSPIFYYSWTNTNQSNCYW